MAYKGVTSVTRRNTELQILTWQGFSLFRLSRKKRNTGVTKA